MVNWQSAVIVTTAVIIGVVVIGYAIAPAIKPLIEIYKAHRKKGKNKDD